MGVLGCAHQRACYVLCQLFDPALVLTAAQDYRANLLPGVPTMLIAMLGHPGFDQFDLSGLSVVLSGGSPVPPELAREVEQRFGVARWFQAAELPLTGSGKIQKFRLGEQIGRAELDEL